MLKEKQEQQFRETNKIPEWEVWDFFEGDYNGANFNERESLRNFMKLVIEKLEKLEK